MILQALHHLAFREGLVEDPDYVLVPVTWLIRIGPDGRCAGIVDTRETPPVTVKNKKPKPVAKRFLVPRQEKRTSGDLAFFLCDKAEYVLGIDPVGEREPARLRLRSGLFRQRVRDCATATNDPGVKAVGLFLDGLAGATAPVDLPADVATNDLFAFQFTSDQDVLVHQRPAVRDYWAGQRALAAPPTRPVRPCLVTGSPVTDCALFPDLKKVPSVAAGVSLVSFNQKAFESYGWDKNENAPISRNAAEVCAVALNRLLDPAPQRASGEGLSRRNLRLSGDTVVCYWSAEPGGDGFSSILGDLLEGNPQDVQEVYQSIWRGEGASVECTSPFYALTLTGTKGRAIVRDWIESTVANVAANLAQHFADIDIVRRPAADGTVPGAFPLGLLLRALAPQGDDDKIPAPHLAQLLDAAMQGMPYPMFLLQRALVRSRAEIGKEHAASLDGFQARQRAEARAAIIKAVLNRRRRRNLSTTHYMEVSRDMNPNHDSEGYALGRLMAVLERIQQAAMNSVNASVVDRYFAGASATPRAVFVRLLKNARHHVRKGMDGDSAGLVFRLDRIVDELAGRFDPVRNAFPAHLDLEQQGLFVLGYHQMRYWLWMNSQDRKAWEQAHIEAPAAYLWKTNDR